MNYKTAFLVLSCFLLSAHTVFAQTQDVLDSLELDYQKRILKSRIGDTYIPKDFQDAFIELKRLSSPEDLKKFAAQDEEEVSRKLHFGLGRWIVVNWHFYEGSRFSHYIREKGVSFPDDMAQVVMRLFHRHLNGVPLMEENLINLYANVRKKEHEEIMDNAETIERRKREE
jgi:hypothetical protein